MTFDELTEFKKDLKNLLKKYRTLNDDLDVVRQVLSIAPKERLDTTLTLTSLRVSNLITFSC